MSESATSERLIKSSGRVRDLGEVFTSSSTVRAMLCLLPDEMWSPHPSPTFFEPACGDGNFLVAIFDRKAKVVAEALEEGKLQAGKDRGAFLFHLLEALSSIYGVDISADNIDGSPDHPLGARERMVLHFQRAAKRTLGRRLSETDGVLRSARWIAWRNVQVGNMLPVAPGDGAPKCPEVPLLEYTWDADDREVIVRSTALADVMAATESETSATLTLFPPPEPTLVWSGKATHVYRVPVEAPAVKIASVRNGHGWRAA